MSHSLRSVRSKSSSHGAFSRGALPFGYTRRLYSASVESVLPKVFQHAEVYGLRAPVEESSDITQELIRRRQVEKAPDLALLFNSLPHLPISIGRLRLSFIFESERGIFPIGMDRDHRIVVLGVAKARQLIEAQDFQLGLPTNQFAAPNQRQVNIIEIQRMQHDGIVQLLERL